MFLLFSLFSFMSHCRDQLEFFYTQRYQCRGENRIQQDHPSRDDQVVTGSPLHFTSTHTTVLLFSLPDFVRVCVVSVTDLKGARLENQS